MRFQPIPGSQPLTPAAAIAPPAVYFFALVLLPPFNPATPPLRRRAYAVLRASLALVAALLFARLPLYYHVPWSAGLTYILSLTGWYGCARVLDVFCIMGRSQIPRRVKRKLKALDDTQAEQSMSDTDAEDVPSENASSMKGTTTAKASSSANVLHAANSKTRRRSIFEKYQNGAIELEDIREALHYHSPIARKREVTVSIERAVTERHENMTWGQRCLYAIDLETSMRGVGWTWTTADVRHSKHTWLPTLRDEIVQLVFSDIPTVTVALLLERYLFKRMDRNIGLDSLGLIERGLLTLSQGVFLFGTFSAGYTGGAIITWPLRKRYREWTTHNLAFWPPLNSEPLTSVINVRQFWSKSWHRLFSRLFLVWGVWPGQWLEKTLVPRGIVQRWDKDLDMGKVLGAFFISGIVHAAAGIAINGGHPSQTFEWLFFWTSGVAVVVEESIMRVVKISRGSKNQTRWYDAWVGRVWTLCVLLWSGQYFTRGWVDSGLVEEMVTLPVDVLKEVLRFGVRVLMCVHDAL